MKKIVFMATVCMLVSNWSGPISAQGAPIFEPIIIQRGNGRSEIRSSNLPANVVAAIKSTQLDSLITVTGAITRTEPIIRVKNLVFQPGSTFEWKFPKNGVNGFVVIAAERLVLNVPTTPAQVATLQFLPDLNLSELNGDSGSAGVAGYSPSDDSGRTGGSGSAGKEGSSGGTYIFPTVYIVFRNLVVNSANPSTVPAVRLLGTGLRGGNGGTGGRGGDGGDGATGTPGRADNIGDLVPIRVCTAGAGRGGDGGIAGPGGRSGGAGTGGNGANIVYVSPSSQWAQIDRLEVSILKGDAGLVGPLGVGGAGGREGGGGYLPPQCTNGRGKGSAGGAANPPNGGLGDASMPGRDGQQFLIDRPNSDLW
jgi:hypothetical protein